MKVIGVIILLIGFIITVFTGFNFTKQEKIVNIENFEIMKHKNNSIHWSPLVGIALIITGGGIYSIGKKQYI